MRGVKAPEYPRRLLLTLPSVPTDIMKVLALALALLASASAFAPSQTRWAVRAPRTARASTISMAKKSVGDMSKSDLEGKKVRRRAVPMRTRQSAPPRLLSFPCGRSC